jgi:hypothetical protein
MTDKDKATYDALIEAAARIVAFEGVSDAPLPGVSHTLASEAIDLRNGWRDFDVDGEPGTQPLPIVDQVADEVFARAHELRRAFVAKIVAEAALRERKPDDTKH